jgi:hypothetical protein
LPAESFNPVFSGIVIEADAAQSSEPLPYLISQLSADEKELYLKIRPNLLECKKSFTIKGTLKQKQFDRIYELLRCYDSFTFHVEDMNASVSDYDAEFTVTYKYSKTNYDKIIKSLNSVSDAIIAKFTEDMKTYNKIKYIYDYLSSSVTYSLDAKHNDTAYGALVTHEAKCDGYARAFTYVCERAGITVTNATGVSRERPEDDDSGHMWNKVRHGDKWYNIDACNSKGADDMTKSIAYHYFMISDKAYKTAFKEEKLKLAVPKAEDDSINYYSVYKLKADSLDSAKAILLSEFQKSFKNRQRSVTIQCSTNAAYLSVMKELTKNNGILELMDDASAAAKIPVVTTMYLALNDDGLHNLTIYFFYPNTKLSSYFTDPSGLSVEELEFFSSYNIK